MAPQVLLNTPFRLSLNQSATTMLEVEMFPLFLIFKFQIVYPTTVTRYQGHRFDTPIMMKDHATIYIVRFHSLNLIDKGNKTSNTTINYHDNMCVTRITWAGR